MKYLHGQRKIIYDLYKYNVFKNDLQMIYSIYLSFYMLKKNTR